ncbi:hypothetical protein DPMN_157111 [Dreissena polymorpha]|uniref:B box-type domain-containing protein n=2 Tax=Dreissena polymorpha TaxID=45954 RepID=A0A9D4EJQ6_DREPO|nr:hypothetical protein DPMN_157111 [Dreissena polymorpha]
MEDLLLKCNIHNNKKLKMFCQDHSQLCCSDCVLLNHRQCTNLALISESVKKLSQDMQQLSNKIQTIISELNEFKSMQESSIQSVEGSYSEKLQEIRELRQQFNAALDKLEHATLKELDETKIALQTSLKKDVDNCSRLKDELQQLGEAAVQVLHDKSTKELEFIAQRKCIDKVQESESYLKENNMKVQSSIIFKANINIEQYLSKQSSLGKIIDSMQSLTLEMNTDQVLTVKRKSLYNVKISQDKIKNCVKGMCSLPGGQVIVADRNNKRVKMLDQHYNVSSHCDLSSSPIDICQITSSEVAVTLGGSDVQFISVSNGQLVNGRRLRLPHNAVGIAHHQGLLYITSHNALYHYTLTGALVKKLYEDTRDRNTVFKCAVSPAGDKIYATNHDQHKLITLATDGTLISTFTDPELQNPECVHITPSGQVIVCAFKSNTVIQVDHQGKKKLATLASQKDGLCEPVSVCYNINTDQIIVEVDDSIMVMDLQ